MEAPHLSQLVKQYERDGLVVLAVNAWDESESVLRGMVRRDDLKQTILLNGSAVYRHYNLNGIPCTLWIDPAGTVVSVESGFDGPEHLQRHTKKLLARG